MEVNAPIVDKLLAFVIDMLIIIPSIIVPLSFLMRNIAGEVRTYEDMLRVMDTNPDLMTRMLVVSVITILLIMFYFVVFEYRLGSTPGKRLLHLKVKSDRKQLKLWQALVRNMELLVLLISNIVTLALVAVDVFSQFGQPERRRILERWSKTRVVKVIPNAR